jgi:hypothetical protein
MKKYFLFVLGIAVMLTACKKEAGEGGTSSIRGKVNVIYRAILTNPIPADTSDAFDTEVYINYGDNIGPDDRIRTNYKGEFEFTNLRPGNYTVYVYSRDTIPLTIIKPEKMVVKREVTIDKRKQNVEIPEFFIYDRN